MKFKNLKGKTVNINVQKYLIDWDGEERSKIQFKIKQAFRPFWKTHVVCAELPLASSRMTIDIYNASQKIAVEIQGAQHTNYNKFFHNESRANFLSQIKRDMDKFKYCEINDIILIEVHENEIGDFCKEWVKERYGIEL